MGYYFLVLNTALRGEEEKKTPKEIVDSNKPTVQYSALNVDREIK